MKHCARAGLCDLQVRLASAGANSREKPEIGTARNRCCPSVRKPKPAYRAVEYWRLAISLDRTTRTPVDLIWATARSPSFGPRFTARQASRITQVLRPRLMASSALNFTQ